MALVKGMMLLAEVWEVLAIALAFAFFVVYTIVWQVQWSIPSLRRRMIEEARRRCQEEEQARRGKYGVRQYRAKSRPYLRRTQAARCPPPTDEPSRI